ncbi:MAG: DNA recombination protein RmuC [Erysipelotrichaceae bacterium]|nr:DNA recombination protein RmuC [Erysipelotrichaceae bacterium]
MTNIEIILIVLISVLVVALIALFLYVINANGKKNEIKDIQVSLNKDLLSFSDKLSDDFSSLSNRTSDKLLQLEERLNKNIYETNKSTNETFLKINERMVKIDETQKSLNELSNDIVSLESILQDKKSRGTFGEIELYSLLETAFGIDSSRYAKQYTLSNNAKADAIIFGPETLGLICIDSKFPLENYRRIYDETLSQGDRDKARNAFKTDVLKHVNDIKNKYIIPGETAEMAYMFIPAEAIFAEIYGNFQEIVDKSYEAKVYIVSPTTLMAYITAIRSIYLGQKKDEKAKEIGMLLNDLSVEFARLRERTETLQRDFEKIIPDFERVAVTSNKIIKRFASINAGEIDDEE